MASASGKSSETPVAGGTVAGYFVSAEDARRAIDELIEKGFDVREIGAAFHSRAQKDPILAVEKEPSRRISDRDDSVAGPASGTDGVLPTGMATGGGTAIGGAKRPGPITGAEIPKEIPSELPRELPTEAEVRAARSQREANRTTRPETPQGDDERSWRERLDTVFGRERGTGRMAESRKFGTGEGHLGDLADYPYSNTAFERSFTDMGIPPEHARRVAHELRHGGAVVTVKAGARVAEAGSVLLRNHGIIRYETPAPRREPSAAQSDAAARMEIFGEVHRVYPNYAPPDRQIARKAS